MESDGETTDIRDATRVLTALVDGPLSAPDISTRTSITERQTRKILAGLRDAGQVRAREADATPGRAGRRPTLWELAATTDPDRPSTTHADHPQPPDTPHLSVAAPPDSTPDGPGDPVIPAPALDAPAPALDAPAPDWDDTEQDTPNPTTAPGEIDAAVSGDPDDTTPVDPGNDAPAPDPDPHDGGEEEGTDSGVDDDNPGDTTPPPSTPSTPSSENGQALESRPDAEADRAASPADGASHEAIPLEPGTVTDTPDIATHDQPATAAPRQITADNRDGVAGPVVCAALTCPLAACPARAGVAPSTPQRRSRARRETNPGAPRVNTNGAVRLAPGALSALVVDLLRTNPEAKLTAGEIGRELTRSSGAVAAAMPKIIAAGQVIQANPGERPARFQTVPST
ncbi:hypothetical protein MXD61_04520 [Frankia sp. AgPm24]|uniref:hypothetical protein n=1 Tax=Frankia sp. AgPm24 TaxID=631128 RepID=UPI00200CD528|nr:hypothetical protein [Frankia sp. AgPm24]MCK9921174.1 hypothetical protein [Frankia sp. AgPm24]